MKKLDVELKVMIAFMILGIIIQLAAIFYNWFNLPITIVASSGIGVFIWLIRDTIKFG